MEVLCPGGKNFLTSVVQSDDGKSCSSAHSTCNMALPLFTAVEGNQGRRVGCSDLKCIYDTSSPVWVQRFSNAVDHTTIVVQRLDISQTQIGLLTAGAE